MDNHDYFDKALTYGSMRKALRRCCRNVRWKDSVVGYELHAPQNTHKLIDSFRDGSYRISPYQRFTVYEPKKREILATRIADRQFQMSLCQAGLYDDFVEHFIYDNCACQIGKGTDFAIKRLKHHMAEYYRDHGSDGWVLALDIHHFFPSTRHDVAKAAVKKRISDKRAADYVCGVIDSFGGDNGIGLGSQISQLVELAVLDDLDHYIKERLRVRHYIRYMDDLRLIHHDREFLRRCWCQIDDKLGEIGFELNRKSTMYPLRQGVKFLQWRLCCKSTGKIILRMNGKKVSRERRRIRKILRKEVDGEFTQGTAYNSLTAWRANAARGNEWRRQINMRNYYYTTKAGLRHGENHSGGQLPAPQAGA